MELENALSDPLVELGAIVSTSLPDNPMVRELLANLEQRTAECWTSFYREIVEHYGVRLRIGVKVEDLPN
jgi:hypothetical protein